MSDYVPTVKWGLKGLAIGPGGDQIEMTTTHYSEPSRHNLDQGKALLETHLWQIFPNIFFADPVRVEVHVAMLQVR